jgi:hypothetical protein
MAVDRFIQVHGARPVRNARFGVRYVSNGADRRHDISKELAMTREELTAWALGNGWQIIAGHPSLTKPSAPKEAVVRMVLKATVVNIEAKKPAGKWEKVSGAAYGAVEPDPETGLPRGLGFTSLQGFRMLMEDNRNRTVFARFGAGG